MQHSHKAWSIVLATLRVPGAPTSMMRYAGGNYALIARRRVLKSTSKLGRSGKYRGHSDLRRPALTSFNIFEISFVEGVVWNGVVVAINRKFHHSREARLRRSRAAFRDFKRRPGNFVEAG